MVSYTLSHQAYLKIFFHAAKYPHKPVNGVLVGKLTGSDTVSIDDAIPLLHHWTGLSPMMEIGLDLARGHAESSGSTLVGYYQACERINDKALAPTGEIVAGKIRDKFKDAVAFVVDGEKLGTGHPALLPYISQAPSPAWVPYASEITPFSPSSPFQFAAEDSPSRAAALVNSERAHQKLWDFDDHLEDVAKDWLRNGDCIGQNS